MIHLVLKLIGATEHTRLLGMHAIQVRVANYVDRSTYEMCKNNIEFQKGQFVSIFSFLVHIFRNLYEKNIEFDNVCEYM